ncbi:hypothetical protein DEU36_2152 [Microbacterium sp. AG238]|nr:hypothetical protein DEU36_2152 [Microbacterium sp. AG238]
MLTHLTAKPVIVDAVSLASTKFIWSEGQLVLEDTEIDLAGETNVTIRGWARRLAPPDWLVDVQAESLDAAIRASWLTIIGALLRARGIHWLSGIDSITAAENKLVMEAAMRRLQIDTPATVVTNQRDALEERLGSEFVAKPLGPGHYFAGEKAFNVFARAMSIDEVDDQMLAAAPFLLQKRLTARRHHRVVVVGGQVWGGCVDAAGLPVDWRALPAAHTSFVAMTVPDELSSAALAVANELGLGYSSQDWIETDDGYSIVDVNPSGQWMFLPDPIGDEVARAIARWLDG